MKWEEKLHANSLTCASSQEMQDQLWSKSPPIPHLSEHLLGELWAASSKDNAVTEDLALAVLNTALWLCGINLPPVTIHHLLKRRSCREKLLNITQSQRV